MKALKSGGETIQKPVKKDTSKKIDAMNWHKADRRKKKGKFDKDCLSETDMDEILAIG